MALVPWWSAFTAGAAAGWLVEAIKNWGLVPQAKAPTTLQGSHQQEIVPLLRQGYNVEPKYSGIYSGGEFELSEATQGSEYLALGTTSHRIGDASRTCTLKFDKPDTINLGLVAKALRSKGFDTDEVEASTLPIHPPSSANQIIRDRRYSPTYMTPSHGTIAWSTDIGNSRGNFATSIRSGIVSADLRLAQLDSGKWTFDIRRV